MIKILYCLSMMSLATFAFAEVRVPTEVEVKETQIEYKEKYQQLMKRKEEMRAKNERMRMLKRMKNKNDQPIDE